MIAHYVQDLDPIVASGKVNLQIPKQKIEFNQLDYFFNKPLWCSLPERELTHSVELMESEDCSSQE